MENPLELKLNSASKIVIKPVAQGFNENTPVCAINWFNLKLGWLYNLYTLIASRFVRQVAGELYFKGKLHSKIEGQEQQQRDNLLIVCYSGAAQFLNLVKIKIFQLISVLRLASVKQFCFGFSENLINKSEVNTDFNKGQLYLVHHFQGNSNWIRENLSAINNAANQYQSEVFFCGLTSAHVAKENLGKIQMSEFFMDGMIIFSSTSEKNFEALIKHSIYNTLKQQNKVNALYLFARTH